MSVVDVPGGRLVTIGTVVAENIARSLDLPESAVEAIEQAMTDEIGALSAHFAFTIEDLRKQWEKAEEKLTQIREHIEKNRGWVQAYDGIRVILDFEPTPEMGRVEFVDTSTLAEQG
jgi:hypothetical protein